MDLLEDVFRSSTPLCNDTIQKILESLKAEFRFVHFENNNTISIDGQNIVCNFFAIWDELDTIIRMFRTIETRIHCVYMSTQRTWYKPWYIQHKHDLRYDSPHILNEFVYGLENYTLVD